MAKQVHRVKGKKRKASATHKPIRARRVGSKVTQHNKWRRVLRSNGPIAAEEYARRHGLAVRVR